MTRYWPSDDAQKSPRSTPQPLSKPPCPVCGKPVPLEAAKTDEHGQAIHEQCYVLKLERERATG